MIIIKSLSSVLIFRRYLESQKQSYTAVFCGRKNVDSSNGTTIELMDDNYGFPLEPNASNKSCVIGRILIDIPQPYWTAIRNQIANQFGSYEVSIKKLRRSKLT